MMSADSLQKWCDRATLCVVVWLLTFPVLAVGGLPYWSRAAIHISAAALLALWGVRVLLRLPEPIRPAVPAAVTRWGVVLLVVLCVPLLPLPPAVVRWVAPTTFEAYGTALAGWPAQPPFTDLFATLGVTPATLPPGLFPASWRPLSLVAYDSWTTLLMGMSYVVLGGVVALYPWGHELRVLRWLMSAVIVVAVAEALYAFVQQSNGGGRILWFACPPHTTCMGTYLNRNHFAGLLEMAFPLLLARAALLWRAHHRLFAQAPAAGGWLRQMAHVLSYLSEPAVGRAVALSCLALLVLAALAASGSRSAFAATLLAVAVTTVGRAHVGSARGRAATLATVAFGVGVWFLFPQFTQRLASGDTARLAIAQDTLDMIKAFPVFGVGVGNFAAGFQLFRRRTIQSWAYGVDVDHAHNDYLEWLAEVGVPAALISLALLVVVTHQIARSPDAPHRRPDEPLLYWGLGTGALALLAHALTDFNLHVPANALIFAFLVGGLLRLARRSAVAPDDLPRRQRYERPRTVAVSALALSLIWIVLAWEHWSAESALRRVYPGDALHSLLAPPPTLTESEALALTQQAVEHLPGAPEAQLGLARQLAHSSDASPAAVAAFVRSLWAAPIQPRALLDLAQTVDPAPPAAVYDLMDRAAALAPYNPSVRLDVAHWYLQRWADLSPAVQQHAVGVADAALALTASLPGSGTPRQRLLDAYQRVVGPARNAGTAPLAPAAFANGAQ